jgi:hypothetical protein
MIRNINLKLEVDTLKNKKVTFFERKDKFMGRKF